MKERIVLRIVYNRNQNLIISSSVSGIQGLELKDAFANQTICEKLDDLRTISNEDFVHLIENADQDAISRTYGSKKGNAFYTLVVSRKRNGNVLITLERTPLSQSLRNPFWAKVLAVVVIALVVSASAIISIVIRRDIYDKKNLDANDTVEMVSEQIDRTVSAEFGSWFDELKMIGTLLNDFPVFSGNEAKIDAVLNGVRQSIPFRNIGLLLNTGDLYITDSNVISIAYETLTRRLVIDKSPAIDVMDLAGEELVVFGVPAASFGREDTGNISAICGIADTSTVSELLKINSFNKSATVSIIKNNGFRVAVSGETFNKDIEYNNFFTMISSCISPNEYAGFEKDFLADKSGMLKISETNEDYYVYYSPMRIGVGEYAAAGQWHLTIFVPQDEIFSSVNELFKTVMLFIVGVLMALSAIAVTIMLMFVRKKNKDVITNRRLMEAEALETTARQTEEASRAKTVFFSNMSHDMRTPLNGILGMTDIANKHINEPEAVKDCIEKIKGAGEHLLGLVNNILDISRIESNKVEIVHEVVNVKTLCDNCYSIVEGQLLTRKLDFKYCCETLNYPNVVGDNIHLKQILINLIGNAIKFTPDGGTVSFNVDEIGAENGNVTYRFVIRDNGVGMSPEFMKHMFEPFTQEAQRKHVTINKGSGLGLTISMQLIKMMGGKLDVDSVEDRGTTMTVTLPFEISPVSFEEVEQEAEKRNERENDLAFIENTVKGKRVLLVEDNELNSEIASTLLKDNGMIVECAVNGKVACDMFAAHKEHYYDAILMDIMMPVMDGITATKTIRAQDNPNAKTIPIIAMTANAFEDDIRRTQEAGMDDHLSKPIRIAEILKSISRLVSKRS